MSVENRNKPRRAEHVKELLNHTAADVSVDIEAAEGNLISSGTASNLDSKYMDFDVGYFTPTMFRYNGVWIAALTIYIKEGLAMYIKYIKNNRLYDGGISFEIPKDVRINIDPQGNIAFLREDEFWYLSVDTWRGPFGENELREFISDLIENNNISTLRTGEKTINDVFMRYAFYEFEGHQNEPTFVCFLNVRLIGNIWVHCRVWGSVCNYDTSSGQQIEDHPVINAFFNSVRKEPAEEE